MVISFVEISVTLRFDKEPAHGWACWVILRHKL